MDSKISFVIPTYNDSPEHLKGAVPSALSQEFGPSEVIVVDDGSTRADLLHFLETLPPSVEVVHQENSGPSAARNAGIRRATGKYIATLDGDDWMDPQFCGEATEVLADPAVEIAFPSTHHFGKEDFYRTVSQDFVLKDFMEMNKVPSAALFRRDRWDVVGGYLESLRFGMEDYEFWVRILRDGGIARPVPTAYLHYRSREDSRLATLDPGAARVTHQAIMAANPDHQAALLEAAFIRLEEMQELYLEYRGYVHQWQDRFRPLIRARDFTKNVLQRRR